MSLKENIEMVKEELNQEEKFFETAVITERFLKKYKMPLISVFVTIVVVLIANSVYQAKVKSSVLESNEAYLSLLENPQDTKASKTLEDTNPSLFDGWRLQVALNSNDEVALQSLTSSSNDVVSDLATYELAALKKDKIALNDYALNQDAILKDLAILDEAILLMEEGNTAEAQTRLNMIDDDSSLQKVVKLLKHYGVK